MAQVTFDGLKQLDKELADALQTIPGLLRDAHEAIGADILSAVRVKIGGAGKVQRWQAAYTGTKGGYAAVRPADKVKDSAGRSVGYVTRAIEVGHRISPPGKSERYRPRIKKSRVPGKQMYAQTQAEAERIAQAAAERVLHAVAEKVEG